MMKNLVWLIACIGVILAAFGCGGSQRPYDPIITATTGTTGTTGSNASFSLTLSPPNESIAIGETAKKQPGTLTFSAKFQVILTPKNGFRGTVNLSAANPTNGNIVAAHLAQTSVSLASGTAQTVALTAGVTSNWDLEFGDYPFPITGTSGSLSQTQTATLMVDRVTGLEAQECAIFSTAGVTMSGNSGATSSPGKDFGFVYGYGPVTLSGNSFVHGTAESTQTVTVSSNTVVTDLGTINYVAPIPLPQLNTNSVKAAATGVSTTSGYQTFSSGSPTLTGLYIGNVTITGTASATIKAPFYVEGSFTVDQNSSVQGGTVYAEGPVTVADNASIDQLSGIALAVVCLASTGTGVTLENFTNVGGIVYCPLSAVLLEDDAGTAGAVFGNGVTLTGNSSANTNTSITWPFS